MARRAWLDFGEVDDDPFGDASGIPTAILSRFAREHVKVALSADGGDEQFCGYTGYRRYPGLYCALRPIPMLLRRALARGLRALPWERLADARLLGADRAALSPDRAARLGRFLDLLDIRNPRELPGLYAARGFPAQPAGRPACPAPPSPVFLTRHEVPILFGAPIDLSGIRGRERAPDTPQLVTARIMQKIEELAPQAGDDAT